MAHRLRRAVAPLRQVAKDFGISETCLQRWLRIADRDFSKQAFCKWRANPVSQVPPAGGSGYAASNELARLYCDVLAGAFNPSISDSAQSTIAAALLGPILA